MAYTAPFIDSSGLHIPSYSDIYALVQQQFLTIYGSSVNVDDDSADMQMISVFSLMLSDAANSLQLAYNARSPLTAVGSDLDAIVKMNGIARKPASYSTAQLLVSGVSGTTINNGAAMDTNGNVWLLPLTFTLPYTGSITVDATCETSGAVGAPAGSIKIISTPTQGWNTVTNLADASPGTPVETDSELRARQSVSVALSSKTLLIGTLSAVAAIPGVTRYAAGIPSPTGTSTSIENPTGAPDYFGNPAHSISMVVEGGTDLDIATAIYKNKSIGCFTNGTTSVAVVDPFTNNTTNISFFRPTYNRTFVTLLVKGLTGFTSASLVLIKNAVYEYLNGLQIGEDLTISGLYSVAMSITPNILIPQYSIKGVYVSTSTASGLAVVSVANGGSGYTVGDVLNVVQTSAGGGTLRVTGVGSGGSVTAGSITAPGTGYNQATVSVTGGTGTGCTLNLLQLGGSVTTDISTPFNAVVQGNIADIFVQVV